jgi:hypothetical protein
MTLLQIAFQILFSGRIFLRDIPIRGEGGGWIGGALILAAVVVLALLQGAGSSKP